MKILGINIASHDTSAALIEDGKLISNNPSVFKENMVNTNKINIKK